MEALNRFDTELFWWINNHNTPWLDVVLWMSSQKWCWLVFLLFVYAAITLKHDRRSWFWVLAGIAMCILLADQISNNAIKDTVMRLRPCYAMEGVRMYNTRAGGLYGFVSSHSSNAFAIAMFISLMYGGQKTVGCKIDDENRTTWLKNQGSGYRNKFVAYVMFFWAAIVGYSRPYLGKHYPGDVLCGALLGIGIGAIVYFAMSKIRERICARSVE